MNKASYMKKNKELFLKRKVYLKLLKMECKDEPQRYEMILHVAFAFQSKQINARVFICQISSLFHQKDNFIPPFLNLWVYNQPQPMASGPDKKQLKEVIETLKYISQIKREFKNDPQSYENFLNMLLYSQSKDADIMRVIDQLSTLFQEKKQLLLGFCEFLPKGYEIEIPKSGGSMIVLYKNPHEGKICQVYIPSMNVQISTISSPAGICKNE